MEWVGLIGYFVCLVLEVAIQAAGWTNSGSHKDTRVSGGRSGGQDPLLDAESIARYVSRTSTRHARNEGLSLATTATTDPMWDRELDG
jgi:hypothetical protein